MPANWKQFESVQGHMSRLIILLLLVSESSAQTKHLINTDNHMLGIVIQGRSKKSSSIKKEQAPFEVPIVNHTGLVSNQLRDDLKRLYAVKPLIIRP